jgi:hypothetical protein
MAERKSFQCEGIAEYLERDHHTPMAVIEFRGSPFRTITDPTPFLERLRVAMPEWDARAILGDGGKWRITVEPIEEP